jgi:hypothetical protein
LRPSDAMKTSMQTSLQTPITDQDRALNERDGVVCLKQMFDTAWIDFLGTAVEDAMADPDRMLKNIRRKMGAVVFLVIWSWLSGDSIFAGLPWHRQPQKLLAGSWTRQKPTSFMISCW